MIQDDMFIEELIPKPLTYNEYIKCYYQYKNGDVKARDMLINSNIRLVLKRVNKKFSQTPYEKKDLVSIGIIGLIKAVDSFDILKNNHFSTYATKCIDNTIFSFIEMNKKHLGVNSFEREIIDSENIIRLGDLVEDKSINIELDYERKELYFEIRNLVNSLPYREKQIIMLYFGFYNNTCYTQETIAKMFNMSRANVYKITKKALKLIKYKLTDSKSEEVKTFR